VARERTFQLHLKDGVQVRVRFRSEKGQVTDFTVQLETRLNGGWLAVVRYDNAHGRPHRDVMDRSGKQIEKTWLLGTANEILTFSINDVTNHWERYLSRFLENGG